MKLISLNTWGGRAGRQSLLDFFVQHNDVDIFCLQEMWEGGAQMRGKIAGGAPIPGDTMHDGVSAVSAVLSEHRAYFRPHFGDWYGLAMFVRKELHVLEEGEYFVYGEKDKIPVGDLGAHARNIQYARCMTPSGIRTIINFHGLWNGSGKGDCEERIAQSQRILDVLKGIDHPFILCGDFNLWPNTECLHMLERAGLRNLITEYGITSTRTRYYSKSIKFADYMLVSAGITVRAFRILPEEVSDHAAMELEFD